MSWSRARVARRIAAAAAYGGGGIGVLGGMAVGLLLTEVSLAKRVIGESEETPPCADGRYGFALALRNGRSPLRLAFLGDSTAAGQGVHRPSQTPGALLASGLAAVAECPVDLRNVATPGARSEDLDRQVGLILGAMETAQDAAAQNAAADATAEAAVEAAAEEEAALVEQPPTEPPPRPDVCVIMIGANDVTHRVPPARSVRLLSAAVRRLRDAGCEVVVGTCPDLGTIEPVYQPLRWIARRLSRQLAAAQTIAVVEQGGRTVSLGDLLGPEFAKNPRELFGPDNYHPSAEGYATAAMAILPTLCGALGLWPEETLEPARQEDVMPVARAAAEAAAEGGAEVTATRGPWALLRRRRRLPTEAGAVPHSPRNRPCPTDPPVRGACGGPSPTRRGTAGPPRAPLSVRLEKSSASQPTNRDPRHTYG
ncbi:SGNH/GDSL hydrolase family protein [Streptomyces sp. XD-27]|uniref:SGNH/GDSL hydrolase family protein n=1 Tax=Streptomyces sp. XD-27 TaxID=3062779 RepID=UPI0026F40ABA|nr:SGNH/GDSL hydrolase family protein [Streptomyces sp. XD-27]WKX70738.1 SGNH/GDSL hydrolase family protein [Streptomyces sp. XD-27]